MKNKKNNKAKYIVQILCYIDFILIIGNLYIIS